MNVSLIYLIKVSGIIAISYLGYKFIFSKDTYFNRNRVYLIGCFVLAVVAPLIKVIVKTVYVKVNPQHNTNFSDVSTTALPAESNLLPIILNVLFIIYLIGVTVSLVRTLIAYYQAIKIISTSEQLKFYELILSLTKHNVLPFSLFKWLVIPKNITNQPDFENIVQHESIHSRQYHSVDLFMAEIMVAFQWYNPFVWMMKRAIVENHEYIVDKTLLKNGVDAKRYQYSLLSYATTGSSQLVVANHFNINLLKKRIRMMNKNQSPGWHRLKNIFVLLIAIVIISATSSFETKVIAQENKEKTVIYLKKQKLKAYQLEKLKPEIIKKITVLNDSIANELFGEEGKDGAVIVQLKDTFINDIHFIGSLPDSTLKNNGDQITISSRSANDSLDRIIVVNNSQPLVFIDEQETTSDDLENKLQNIEKIELFKGDKAFEKYGVKAKDGVIKATTKKNGKKSVSIRPVFSGNADGLLYIIDGEVSTSEKVDSLDPQKILSIEVLKGDQATKQYGKEGKNGVIKITTK